MTGVSAMVEAVSHLALRPLEPTDTPVLFSSWLKSYRKSQERELARIDRNAHFDVRAFYESQDCTINRLLRRCTAVVMCSPSRPADIHHRARSPRLSLPRLDAMPRQASRQHPVDALRV